MSLGEWEHTHGRALNRKQQTFFPHCKLAKKTWSCICIPYTSESVYIIFSIFYFRQKSGRQDSASGHIDDTSPRADESVQVLD